MRGNGGRVVAGIATIVCLVAGAGLLATDGFLRAKGAMASILIDRSLEFHLRDGAAHPPWRWADMHPVARLEVERLGVRRPVLWGSSGESMAFGIGHVVGTGALNGSGNCVLAGHRSSAMRWLKDLDIGDRITLRSHDATTVYAVSATRVVDHRDTRVMEPTTEARLTLVTCYPIDGLLPGDDRYVVTAEAVHRHTHLRRDRKLRYRSWALNSGEGRRVDESRHDSWRLSPDSIQSPGMAETSWRNSCRRVWPDCDREDGMFKNYPLQDSSPYPRGRVVYRYS